jgi:hypothetical protein
LQADVTILQQINGNPLRIVRRAPRTIADQQRLAPTLTHGQRIEDVKAAQFAAG